MAIYGLNFNGSQIPANIKKRFAEVVKPFGMVKFRLVGVATSEVDRDACLAVATNGTRDLHVEIRDSKVGKLYGIYAH